MKAAVRDTYFYPLLNYVESKLFLVLNLLYLVMSSFAWPTAYLPTIAVPALGIITYVPYFFLRKVTFKWDFSTKALLITFLIFVTYHCFIGAFTICLYYIPPILLCLLDRSMKEKLLSFITKWYAIAIGISLVIFGLTWIVPLPSFGQVTHYMYPPYNNFIMYLQSVEDYRMIRFNGFFFEPGHCAIVGVFLLYANRFQFKKRPILIIILLSILFSLSLAGYVLFMTGIFLQNYKRIKIILGAVLVIGGLYLFVAYVWDDGNNPVNLLIVERLEIDENGKLKGDNRAYADTERVLDRAYKTGEIWAGIGMVNFNRMFNHAIAGSGYKIFLLQYGLLGVLVTALIYWSYYTTALRENKKFAILFLLFIAFCFIQRCYAFWFSWQLPFICSIGIPKDFNFTMRKKRLTLNK